MRLDRIESINEQQLFNNQNVTFSATEPLTADKVNGALWFEPNALFPQPWIYDTTNAVWWSSPYQQNFEITFTAAKLYQERALYFYNSTANKTKFIRADMLIANSSTTTAHSAANNNFFTLFKLSSGTPLVITQFHSFATTTAALAANGAIRVAESINQIIAGNSWGWRMYTGRTGSPTDILVNVIFTMQSARS